MNLNDVLVDIARTPEQIRQEMMEIVRTSFCHCGNPKIHEDLFCVSCKCERYAERKQHEAELRREVYHEGK